MIKKSAIALACAASLFTAASTAQASTYIGGSFSVLNYEEPLLDDVTVAALNVRAGVNFNDYLSGEFRLGYGTKGDRISVMGAGVDFDLDSYFGAYVRAGFGSSMAVNPYAVVGYNRIRVSAAVSGTKLSVKDHNFGYGVGFDVPLADDMVFNVEYMELHDENNFNLGGISVGVVKNF